MTTITITSEIEKEINAEIVKAARNIEREMAYSIELRNYATIERNAKYINEMKASLIKGEL